MASKYSQRALGIGCSGACGYTSAAKSNVRIQPRLTSQAPFGQIKPEDTGVVLPPDLDNLRKQHKQQVPPKMHVPAPSDASKLKDLTNVIMSHLNARQAIKFGIPVTAQDIWDWMARVKKWTTYNDAYLDYRPAPLVSWESWINIGFTRYGEYGETGGCSGYSICGDINPQLWQWAWQLCAMKAADEYMGVNAISGPKINLPIFNSAKITFLTPLIQSGQLDRIAKSMNQRLNVAKAAMYGVPNTEGALFQWIIGQKNWKNHSNMYAEYGNLEQWANQYIATIKSASKETGPFGEDWGSTGDYYLNLKLKSLYIDLLYPMSIEQAVDQYLAYAAGFKNG